MLRKTISTAFDVLNRQGLQQVALIGWEKVAIWWRRGDPLHLGKYVGRPDAVARLDGCRFGLTTPVVSDTLKYLLLSGKHEAAERALIKRFVDPSLPIVEFGGSIGVVSCIANRLLHDATRHVVVEANPSLIPALAANRDLNGCQFTIVNSALAYGGPTVLFPVGSDVLASSVRRAAEHSVRVPAVTLAELLDQHQFERCTLICDIEGAEVDLVLREAPTLAARVDAIIMEVHPRLVGRDEHAGLLRELQRMGFDTVGSIRETMAWRKRPAAAESVPSQLADPVRSAPAWQQTAQ